MAIKDKTAGVALIGKIALFYVLVYIFQGLIYGNEMWANAFGDTPGLPGNPSVVEALIWALTQMWSFTTFIFNITTFNIPELPAILRVVFVTPLVVVIILTVYLMVRSGHIE